MSNKISTVSKAAPKKRRKIVSLDKRKARRGYLFVLPFIIGFLLIYAPIVFDSLRYSFSAVSMTSKGMTIKTVGFLNYRNAIFVDPGFVQTLKSGIIELFIDIPVIVIFSLFMAVLLNQKMFGRAVFRAIFFVPVILCTGLIDEINNTNASFNSCLSNTTSSIDTGSGTDSVSQIVSKADISWMFASMKVGTEITSVVVGWMNKIYEIVNRSGVQMLIFLAGLQSISPAIYESCDIDGASAWEAFWKVTIPMVSPMILVNAIYTIIDALTSSTNSVMVYIDGIYKGNGVTGSGGREMSSAMSWMYFLMVMVIIALVSLILSIFVFYQRRD